MGITVDVHAKECHVTWLDIAAWCRQILLPVLFSLLDVLWRYYTGIRKRLYLEWGCRGSSFGSLSSKLARILKIALWPSTSSSAQ